MTFLIVGANGNFSLALQEILGDNSYRVIDKNLYGNWENSESKLTSVIRKNFEEYNTKYLINTVGIISKNYNPEFVKYWNYCFPKHLYQICENLNLTLVTLGSVHENIPDMPTGNPYLESKKSLEQFLVTKEFRNSLHFQFHTWYGGKNVNPEMFLGQLITSIRDGRFFNMSSGNQVREYHHVIDDATCVLTNLENGMLGTHSISHGELLTLEEIARKLFRHFDCENLLKLNQISSPNIEVTNRVALPVYTFKTKFRPTIEGLIEYVAKKI